MLNPLSQLKPVNDLTVMVRDQGQFCEIACRIARDAAKVYYCSAREGEFPTMADMMVGYGMEGLEVVDSIWPYVDRCDLFVYPDLYYGYEQDYLRSLGKPVWGAGMGEDLELDRILLKQILKSKGMPVNDFEVVVGMEKLRAFLKANEDVYVKMSKFRGSFESLHSKTYKEIAPALDEFAHELGAFQQIAEFICEAPIPDAAEIGYDGYTVDGQFPKSTLAGIEIKDRAYVGAIKSYASLPSQIKDTNAALVDSFKQTMYRGPFSTEVRVPKDKNPYLIDFTARYPSPPNQLQQEMFSNFTEILWEGANGRLVDPVPAAKFGALCIITSDFATKNWQPVEFPKELRGHIKLNNPVKIKDTYYVVPQPVELCQIGAVSGWGATMEEAIDQCKEIAGKVSGYGICIPTEAFDDAKEEIEKSKAMGVSVL